MGFLTARTLLTSRLPDDPVNSEHGEEAIKELNADFGIPASFYRVDVRDHVAVEEAVNGIVRDFGGIDVLLCSAGKPVMPLALSVQRSLMLRRNTCV